MCKFETKQPQQNESQGGGRKPINDLVAVLQPNDRLSIVSFESNASRDCPLVRMNSTGKSVVKELMKKLRPGGSTNIGSGIYTALKVLNDRRQRNPVSSVLLLGDG